MTPSDILDAVYEQVSWYEGEIGNLEDEITCLESHDHDI